MQQNHFITVGKVTYMSNVTDIQTKKTNKSFSKVTLGIELNDGQKVYPEIRRDALQILKENPILVGDTIQFSFTLQASEKDEKFYNNVHIQNYKVV